MRTKELLLIIISRTIHKSNVRISLDMKSSLVLNRFTDIYIDVKCSGTSSQPSFISFLSFWNIPPFVIDLDDTLTSGPFFRGPVPTFIFKRADKFWHTPEALEVMSLSLTALSTTLHTFASMTPTFLPSDVICSGKQR